MLPAVTPVSAGIRVLLLLVCSGAEKAKLAPITIAPFAEEQVNAQANALAKRQRMIECL